MYLNSLNQNPWPPTKNIHVSKMREFHRIDEESCLSHLVSEENIDSSAIEECRKRSEHLIRGIRKKQTKKGGIDALLQEFSLNTKEGLALMCLAEASLRTTDKQTLDTLIEDKLTNADWSAHIGKSPSLFVNFMTCGFCLASKVLRRNQEKNIRIFNQIILSIAKPIIRSITRLALAVIGRQFVLGENIGAAKHRAKANEKRGYTYSYDMLGEGARTQKAADRYFHKYMEAIIKIGESMERGKSISTPGISVKLSAIHPRFEYSQRKRVITELVPKLLDLAITAKNRNLNFTVDAEECERLELTLEVIEQVFSNPSLESWTGFGFAVQAYQKRALHVIDWAKALAEKTGRKMAIRLVKGAYWDSEIKWSQEHGYKDYPVFTRKQSTDLSYQVCAKRLLRYRDFLYPQFATHNAYSVAMILTLDNNDQFPHGQGYEFQRLHGMGEELYDELIKTNNIPCRIYAPVGEQVDLLAYLVRRLLENGANSSFVNNVRDESFDISNLLEDPLKAHQNPNGQQHPLIPLPKNIYKDYPPGGNGRENSRGLDLSDQVELRSLDTELNNWWDHYKKQDIRPEAGIANPALLSEKIGEIIFTSKENIEASAIKAHSSFTTWSATSLNYRTNLLQNLASNIEKNRAVLIGLCVKEAGKTLSDSTSEVREAIDFCRYYAEQTERHLRDPHLEPRGVILCISPWNFPLAIFLGQVVAALAAGNTVIAKPAEQTSLIALEVEKLMQLSGVPKGVFQLVLSRGKPVGDLLLPNPIIQGVLFTGSTETAKFIEKKIADTREDNIPLIAETGGQNAMIVDSSALLEQVVDDVIQSGFHSAGQRCSALRVLFVQEDIAGKLIHMLTGAMQEMALGDPAQLETDIGPLIDAQAIERLHSHTKHLHNLGSNLNADTGGARALYTYDTKSLKNLGHFYAPRLYEISHMSVLPREAFGPIVHFIRFKSNEITHVIEQINNCGYGLTLGVHSRIDSVATKIADSANVGNVYINRNMVGAVVGVQPFGGRGLSGTGPKAGGPHYLPRLMKEKDQNKKTVCNNSPTNPSSTKNLISYKIDSMCAPHMSLKERTQILKITFKHFVDYLNKEHQTDFKLKTEELLRLAPKHINLNVSLKSITGEKNTLTTEPRGLLLILSTDKNYVIDSLMQISMAILCGNPVILAVSEENTSFVKKYLAKLPLEASDKTLSSTNNYENLTTLLNTQEITGIINTKDSIENQYIRKKMANRNGPIIPLINETHPALLLPRLQLEKTISTDMTAAGGNASLLTIPEPEVLRHQNTRTIHLA